MRKRKLKKKNIFIAFLLLIILIFLIIFIINHLPKDNKKETSVFKTEQNKWEKYKYYLKNNQKRYEVYFSTHPEADLNDVIAIVNVNADKEAYKESNEANLQKGQEILVNKYHSLAENYTPKSMVEMDKKYAYEGRKALPEVNEAFKKMYEDALKENIEMYVVSAFRSYTYQGQLYTNYITTYGEKYANTVSARPGYSEHQTGLALDILSDSVEMKDFESTKAFAWLKENSYKYGFILRYPKDKEYLTGYAYEPGHYRYLGKELAKKVWEENITYDEYYAYYLDN